MCVGFREGSLFDLEYFGTVEWRVVGYGRLLAPLSRMWTTGRRADACQRGDGRDERQLPCGQRERLVVGLVARWMTKLREKTCTSSEHELGVGDEQKNQRGKHNGRVGKWCANITN